MPKKCYLRSGICICCQLYEARPETRAGPRYAQLYSDESKSCVCYKLIHAGWKVYSIFFTRVDGRDGFMI